MSKVKKSPKKKKEEEEIEVVEEEKETKTTTKSRTKKKTSTSKKTSKKTSSKSSSSKTTTKKEKETSTKKKKSTSNAKKKKEETASIEESPPKERVEADNVENEKLIEEKKEESPEERYLVKPKKVIQPEVNIGTIGHVDNGKSTLVKAITGKFPDEHSEELKRGITIRLGYADADIRECPKCPEPEKYSTKKVCPHCGSKTKLLRRVSFVDCPGHEILMRTMLSGAALMDGVILVIAANQKCPQPQTREHLAAVTALGVKNIIIVQNKVELVSWERAIESYNEIKEFVKGTIAENAPIIPVSAMHEANIDVLLEAIQKYIPTPKRDPDAPSRMLAARSFDVNRPGTRPEDLKGGVLGGSISRGTIKIGDRIEIRPGLKKRGKDGKIHYIPITTTVTSIVVGTRTLADKAGPGGLVAIGTLLDPAMTRTDNLAGSIISAEGHSPEIKSELEIEYKLFDTVVGSEDMVKVEPIKTKEPLMLNIGTGMTIGIVKKVTPTRLHVILNPPLPVDTDLKVSISRQFGRRWRLIGYGDLII